jgi:hypothetical protein
VKGDCFSLGNALGKRALNLNKKNATGSSQCTTWNNENEFFADVFFWCSVNNGSSHLDYI